MRIRATDAPAEVKAEFRRILLEIARRLAEKESGEAEPPKRPRPAK